MSEIGIKLEGDNEFLDTPEDIEIELQLENPILGDADRLSPGSFTLPFNLPGGDQSPGNAAKLKHPDVIASIESYVKQKAGLFIEGQPYKAGILKPRVSDERDRIQANFLFGLNSISEEFKKAKLRDVLDEVVIIDNEARLREVYIKLIGDDGDTSRTITVNGKSYTADDFDSIRIAINVAAEATLDSGQWVPYAQFVTSGFTPGGISQPFLRVWLVRWITFYDPLLELEFEVMENCPDPLQELSITVDDPDLFLFDTWNMADYYAAFATFLDGYITGDYPTEKFRFPVFFNANLHEGQAQKSSEVINAVDEDGMVRNYPLAETCANSLQPFLLLKWILDKIADRFGFTLAGDFYENPDVATILIDNSVTLDVVQDFVRNKKFIFWRRSINLNELVPEVSVVDFLKLICGRYNVAMYYDELSRRVLMTLREPLALSYNYEDVTSMASPVKGSEDLRITGYTMRVEKEDSDAFSVEESITIGVAEDDFSIRCGRLHEKGNIILGGLLVGPRVSRKNGEKFGLRIFHYRGMVNNGVMSYPAADLHGATLYESLTDFVALTGLHNRFHRYWLLFQKNRMRISLEVSWPLRHLLRFDWTLKRMFDRSLFLVKTCKFRITHRGISKCDVELFTMK